MKVTFEGSSKEIAALVSAVQEQKEAFTDVKVKNQAEARERLNSIANRGINSGSFKIDVSYQRDRVERLADIIKNNFHIGAIHIMLAYPKEQGERAIRQYITAIHLQSDQKYIYSVEKGDIYNCHIITDCIDERTAYKRAGENAIVRYERIEDIEGIANNLARYITLNSLRYTKSRNCTGGEDSE